MEHQGEAPLIQRSGLYIDQGLFIGEFTDLFAKPQRLPFLLSHGFSISQPFGWCQKSGVELPRKTEKHRAEKTTLTMSDSWFTIVLYPLVSLLKIPDHLDDLDAISDYIRSSMFEEPPKSARFSAQRSSVLMAFSCGFPHHFLTISTVVVHTPMRHLDASSNAGSHADHLGTPVILCVEMYVCMHACMHIFIYIYNYDKYKSN